MERESRLAEPSHLLLIVSSAPASLPRRCHLQRSPRRAEPSSFHRVTGSRRSLRVTGSRGEGAGPGTPLPQGGRGLTGEPRPCRSRLPAPPELAKLVASHAGRSQHPDATWPLRVVTGNTRSSGEARGLGEGVEQLEVTVPEVILHVIPEVHCGRTRPEQEGPEPAPHCPPRAGRSSLTGDAGLGLPHVVEPQGRQVEQLAGPQRAAQGPGLAVGGVPSQVRGQRVQGDPGHLGTQRMRGAGSKPLFLR